MKTQQRHGFHLVDPSPCPLMTAFAALLAVLGGVLLFHSYSGSKFILTVGLISLPLSMFIWWYDVTVEATYEGHHTSVVQYGMKWGMILFIASEVMFFFAFFWAFFSCSLSPTIEIGAVFPPKGIAVMNPNEIPFLNTLILLTSGATLTWAHHAIVSGDRFQAIAGILITLGLAFLFTALQVFEYFEAGFNITDSVYGSTFYMATGFHGFHVVIGSLFILVCFLRLVRHHFSKTHHFGFEGAAYYWHFVDVVWLFLYVVVYHWGGL